MRTAGLGLSACTPTKGVFPISSRIDSIFTVALAPPSGALAPGDGREDRDLVALGDLGVELVEVPDVVVVHVDVDELVQGTRVVDELTLEAGVRADELGEDLADRRAVRLDRRGAVRGRAEQGGQTHFDSHLVSL